MQPYRTTAYRYPNEGWLLTLSFILVFGVIIITSTATLCLSSIFIIGMVVMAYLSNQSHHAQLMRQAKRVTAQSAPQLTALVRQSFSRIQPGPVDLFVVPAQVMNAYTFGLSNPKVVVLFSEVLNVMDEDEIRFVVGHELGHVSLGHTWLNTLLGGMAGIPAPFGAAILLTAGFLWWNRACEYSADRAGMLACGKPAKAISALVKLAAGPGQHNSAELARVYQMVDDEDENLLSLLGETFSSHPMIIKRINQIKTYAASAGYQQLQARLNQNGG